MKQAKNNKHKQDPGCLRVFHSQKQNIHVYFVNAEGG